MYNQIVYGSLLHPMELKKHNIFMDNVEFVKVNGFKRVFNQKPTFRKVNSIHKAVLNIQKDENSWFNAILIKNITENSLKELDAREAGYDKINLKDGLVTYYKDDKIAKNCFVYIGKAGKQNDEILPNIKYFQLCLDGAKEHFRQFHEDYLKTTYQNSQGQLELIKA